MDEQNQIIAETINTSRFFIIFMSYMLGGTYLSVGLASILQSPIIGMIGLVLFAVLPLSLMRRISGFFTNNIRVDFFSDHLAVLVFKSETDSLLNERVIYYKELMSCTINSTQNRYSVIYFNIMNTKKVKYTFKSSLEDKSKNISVLIYANIKSRNNDIKLKPTFFASKQGSYYMIGLGIFMVILMLLHLFYSPGTSVFTFFICVSLFVNILYKRKRDIELNNKMNKPG